MIVAVLVLALGTFAFRLVGPALRSRVTIPPDADRLIAMAVAVILVALIATNSLLVGRTFAGFACPIGVVVAGVLAWRKAPFVLVVVAAAATTAGLRFVGVA